MIDDTPAIHKLHQAYEQLTGLSVPLSFDKMHLWRVYIDRGFTEADLRLTVAMIQHKVDKVTAMRIFRFSRFIGNIEQLSEDIAEARALHRIPKPTERDKVLAMSGRTAPQSKGIGTYELAKEHREKSAAAVMAGNAALAQLLKLRDSL